MDPNILEIENQFDLTDFMTHSAKNTRKVFHWLPRFTSQTQSTYCLLNLNWPTDNLIQSIPRDYDRYIISFHLEYPDFDWIKKFCDHFSNRQIVCVIAFDNPHMTCENLIYIKHDVWPAVLKLFQDDGLITHIPDSVKSYKLSALNSRIDQFKAYATAHIIKNYSSGYVVSWLANLGKTSDLFWLDVTTGNNKIDSIKDWIVDTDFINTKIMLDNFTNNPLHNLVDYHNDAYIGSVVNLTNESVCNSYYNVNGKEYINAGPFVTEKTMKPMLAGTAVVPVGQYQTYNYLSASGFDVDYPWDTSYDNDPGNISRIASLLDTIDQILGYELSWLEQQTRSSRLHNQNHIISGEYYNVVNHSNMETLSKHVNV